ncbi:CitMHS family transporter [Pseudomonas matsuisoli]|uniref:Citrate transporter n=1 Tax=Pseudomonas matsuisoli TaxID=1515666 RepID=A0A917PUQ0_9PSED|nr:citrate:proton symporter [Pseudomonas matsuisoli]GGJ92222.1 citrate transporter [Pseudomonas matsuisoli]
MLTLIGLLTMGALVLLLIVGRTSPVIPLISVPLIGALFAGFGPAELTTFFNEGIGKVMPIAVMFIFAIIFFGVLQDTGLFRPLINTMVRVTRGNVVAVAVATAIIGMLAHLDGAGATTFLLTVPALLPLYRELRMSPYLMLLLLAMGAGIFNMLPWAGPLGRASAVTGIDLTELWRGLIPVQVVGAALLILLAIVLGLRERRRIDSGTNTPTAEASQSVKAGIEELSEEARALQRPGLMWFNGLLFLAVLVSLFSGALPAGYIFMIALCIVLIVNYPGGKQQMSRVTAHAGAALNMGMIILAAGTMLGVLAGTKMLTSIAQDLVTVLPEASIPLLHIILGVFGLPMELLLSTDAYYFGLMPIVLEVAGTHGVDPASVVYALMVGNIIGTFISPFSPALWLALGLANLDLGRHIRYSLFWMWGFSLVLLAFCWSWGLL